MSLPLTKCCVLVAVSLLLGCGTPPTTETLCFDAVDNDENGQVDCADPACATVPGCATTGGGDGGDSWGTECTAQSQCLDAGGYASSPLEMCVRGRCSTPEDIVVKMTIDASTYSGVANRRSMLTRIVSKTAIDGSAVTCDSLASAAPSKLAEDADQLADSGKFNLLSWDTVPIDVAGGLTFEHSRLYTNVGKDFLIWVEIWTGNRSNNLPTGSRAGWTCVDNESELLPSDDLDSGDGRNIAITLVAPQG